MPSKPSELRAIALQRAPVNEADEAAIAAFLDALWAESNRAVDQRSVNKPAGAVQPCVSCGLSLSATARFCRRCGSAQG